MNDNSNILNGDKYLIPRQLHYLLDTNNSNKQNTHLDKYNKGLYLMCIRVIKNNDTTNIIYNYIYYDINFFYCLISYLY